MTWQNLPPHKLYPQLIPHVLKLCLKYKVPISIIVNSNKAFPYGGLPFASKKSMFDVFVNSDEFLKYDIITTKMNLAEKLEIANKIVKKDNFPIIIKPDSSHRGIDVKLVKDSEELENILINQKWDYIIQEYCNYEYEFGIFYCRLPDKNRGEIVSLSAKYIPIIIGDGVKNIKTLILESNAENKEVILKSLSHKLNDVLEKNERFLTIVCASHAQGAIFKDAKNLITNQLIEKIDQISNIEGFNFGRFDVKADSINNLQKGIFKIIEINGATSEFINIYDSNYTLKQGINELKKQWDLLFEISYKNSLKDKIDLSMYDFIRKYIDFFYLTKKVTGRFW